MRIPIAVAFLQFTIAISALLPGIKNVWNNGSNKPDPTTVLAVNLAVLPLGIGLTIVSETRRHENLLRKEQSATIETRWLKAPDFYQQFLTEAKIASDQVDIAYFATYPPSLTADAARLKYYNDLVATVRKSTAVTFRRIVRHSDANKPWIRETLTALQKCRNFSLALVHDDESKEQCIALSIQIIDRDKAWLVAVRSHEPSGGPRDLFLRSQDAAQALRLYYERVWNRSTILMKQGNLTNEGETYTKDAT